MGTLAVIADGRVGIILLFIITRRGVCADRPREGRCVCIVTILYNIAVAGYLYTTAPETGQDCENRNNCNIAVYEGQKENRRGCTRKCTLVNLSGFAGEMDFPTDMLCARANTILRRPPPLQQIPVRTDSAEVVTFYRIP